MFPGDFKTEEARLPAGSKYQSGDYETISELSSQRLSI
jgi:hypothetical protein